MSDLTPEERVRRVKAALAEAGYSPADVTWSDFGVRGIGSPSTPEDGPPLDVWWRALLVAREPNLPCWPCFLAPGDNWEMLMACDHDPLTAPWPAVGAEVSWCR